jgi:hypothetical protein
VRVQKMRKEYDKYYNPDVDCPPLMESCTRELLLHLSGSLRKYVGEMPEEGDAAPGPKEGDELTFKLRRRFYRQADADTDLIIDAVRSIVPEDMSDAALLERISDARAFARDHPGSRAEYLRNR